MMQFEAEAKGARIEMNPTELLFPDSVFKIDAARIQQVLINLISNSIKFCLHNGHIMVSMSVDFDVGNESTVVVTVQDNGVGMIEAEVQRIFDPFYTNRDENMNPQGTGLGLNISKLIASRLNGGI